MGKKSFSRGVDSLFNPIDKPQKKKTIKPQIKKTTEKFKGSDTPKWEKLWKVGTLLERNQKSFLDNLALKIMSNRARCKSNDKERITTNTILRSLVRVLELHEDKLETDNIKNEDELTERLKKILT